MACLESPLPARRIAHVRGAQPSSPSPDVRAALASIAITPAGNVPTSIATASSTSARCARCLPRSQETHGPAAATSAAASSRRSAGPTRCAPACDPRARGARHCAARWRNRSRVTTSPRCILVPAGRAPALPMRIRSGTASARRTNSRAEIAARRHRQSSRQACRCTQLDSGELSVIGAGAAVGLANDGTSPTNTFSR